MTPHRRHLLGAIGTAALALNGCKSLGGRDAAPSTNQTGDPLLGGRIPARGDVPTKDPVAENSRDPILSTPAGRLGGKRPSDPKALPPRTANANDPGREPFRPGLEHSPAAMAAGAQPDAELNLERGTPTGSGGRFDQAAEKLKAAGATVGTPTRTATGYTVVVTVPLDGDPPGTRSYTGAGGSAAAAAEDALAQVKAERK